MLLKVFCSFLTFVLLLTNCVLAHAAETNFWKERRKAVNRTHPADPTLLASLPAAKPPISDFARLRRVKISDLPQQQSSLKSSLNSLLTSLSHQYGTIRKISGPTDKPDKVVIHIQDVHQNKEAQQNIGKTIQALIDQNVVDMVALEGAFRPINLTAFREFPHKDTVKKVADFLLRENKISGPIHTAFTSPKDIPVFVGVDDQTQYEANVEAYKKSAGVMEAYTKELNAQKEKLENEKVTTLNKQLLTFNQKIQAYRDKKIRFGEYVKLLSSDIPFSSPQMDLFLEALYLEETLNLKQVEAERSTVLHKLLRKMDKGQTSELMSVSMAYQFGKVSHSDFYEYVKALCKEEGVNLTQFPAMNDYIRYTLLSQKIEAETLFKEVNAREKTIYESLIKTQEERTLIDQSKRLYLTRKLISFSLSPEEWDEYKKAKIENRKWKLDQGKLINKKFFDPFSIFHFPFSPFERFYEEAEIRDKAMATNLLKAMDKHGAKVAVLVTGGFHSKGIQNQLSIFNSQFSVKEESNNKFHKWKLKNENWKFSYIEYVPKITKVDTESGSKYLSVFTQEKSPLEKLFDGEKLFLAQEPLSVPVHRLAGFYTAGLATLHKAADLPIIKNWLETFFSLVDIGIQRAREGLVHISGIQRSDPADPKPFTIAVGSNWEIDVVKSPFIQPKTATVAFVRQIVKNPASTPLVVTILAGLASLFFFVGAAFSDSVIEASTKIGLGGVAFLLSLSPWTPSFQPVATGMGIILPMASASKSIKEAWADFLATFMEDMEAEYRERPEPDSDGETNRDENTDDHLPDGVESIPLDPVNDLRRDFQALRDDVAFLPGTDIEIARGRIADLVERANSLNEFLSARELQEIRKWAQVGNAALSRRETRQEEKKRASNEKESTTTRTRPVLPVQKDAQVSDRSLQNEEKGGEDLSLDDPIGEPEVTRATESTEPVEPAGDRALRWIGEKLLLGVRKTRSTLISAVALAKRGRASHQRAAQTEATAQTGSQDKPEEEKPDGSTKTADTEQTTTESDETFLLEKKSIPSAAQASSEEDWERFWSDLAPDVEALWRPYLSQDQFDGRGTAASSYRITFGRLKSRLLKQDLASTIEENDPRKEKKLAALDTLEKLVNGTKDAYRTGAQGDIVIPLRIALGLPNDLRKPAVEFLEKFFGARLDNAYDKSKAAAQLDSIIQKHSVVLRPHVGSRRKRKVTFVCVGYMVTSPPLAKVDRDLGKPIVIAERLPVVASPKVDHLQKTKPTYERYTQAHGIMTDLVPEELSPYETQWNDFWDYIADQTEVLRGRGSEFDFKDWFPWDKNLEERAHEGTSDNPDLGTSLWKLSGMADRTIREYQRGAQGDVVVPLGAAIGLPAALREPIGQFVQEELGDILSNLSTLEERSELYETLLHLPVVLRPTISKPSLIARKPDEIDVTFEPVGFLERIRLVEFDGHSGRRIHVGEELPLVRFRSEQELRRRLRSLTQILKPLLESQRYKTIENLRRDLSSLDSQTRSTAVQALGEQGWVPMDVKSNVELLMAVDDWQRIAQMDQAAVEAIIKSSVYRLLSASEKIPKEQEDKEAFYTFSKIVTMGGWAFWMLNASFKMGLLPVYPDAPPPPQLSESATLVFLGVNLILTLVTLFTRKSLYSPKKKATKRIQEMLLGLGQTGDDRFLPLVIKAAESPNVKVRLAAIKAMENFLPSHPELLEKLGQYASEAGIRIQKTALDVLSRGGEAAVPILENLVRSEEGYVRGPAKKVLRKLSRQVETTSTPPSDQGGLIYPIQAPFIALVSFLEKRHPRVGLTILLTVLLNGIIMPLIENGLWEFLARWYYGTDILTQPMLLTSGLWFAGVHIINLIWVFLLNRLPRAKAALYGKRAPLPDYGTAFLTLLAAALVALITVSFGWSPWSWKAILFHVLINIVFFLTTGFRTDPNSKSTNIPLPVVDVDEVTVRKRIDEIQTAMKEDVREFHRQVERHGIIITEDRLLEGIASFFGEEGEQDYRHNRARSILGAINSPETRWAESLTPSSLKAELIDFLKTVTWTSSGAHRYMPLALAVTNQREGRPVFSPEPIGRLEAALKSDYLRTTYPLLANPYGVDEAWIPDPPRIDLPCCSEPRGQPVRWLDVGSAPRNQGSATLNVIRDTFHRVLRQPVEIVGTDMTFPRVQMANGVVSSSPFNTDSFNEEGQVELNGVTYRDARIPQNDVTSESFDQGTFDYISLAMTLHHLSREGEEIEETKLTDDIQWTDEHENPIPTPVYWLTPTQKRAIGNLLMSLNSNGILFLNMWGGKFSKEGRRLPGDDRNSDLYLIIQRDTENQFRIYSSAIPFRPDGNEFSLENHILYPRKGFSEKGLIGYLGQDKDNIQKIIPWLRAADKLVLAYQRRDHSLFHRMRQMIAAIDEGATIDEVLELYLKDVPDSDDRKEKLLQKLPPASFLYLLFRYFNVHEKHGARVLGFLWIGVEAASLVFIDSGWFNLLFASLHFILLVVIDKRENPDEYDFVWERLGFLTLTSFVPIFLIFTFYLYLPVGLVLFLHAAWDSSTIIPPLKRETDEELYRDDDTLQFVRSVYESLLALLPGAILLLLTAQQWRIGLATVALWTLLLVFKIHDNKKFKNQITWGNEAYERDELEKLHSYLQDPDATLPSPSSLIHATYSLAFRDILKTGVLLSRSDLMRDGRFIPTNDAGDPATYDHIPFVNWAAIKIAKDRTNNFSLGFLTPPPPDVVDVELFRKRLIELWQMTGTQMQMNPAFLISDQWKTGIAISGFILHQISQLHGMDDEDKERLKAELKKAYPIQLVWSEKQSQSQQRASFGHIPRPVNMDEISHVLVDSRNKEEVEGLLKETSPRYRSIPVLDNKMVDFANTLYLSKTDKDEPISSDSFTNVMRKIVEDMIQADREQKKPREELSRLVRTLGFVFLGMVIAYLFIMHIVGPGWDTPLAPQFQGTAEGFSPWIVAGLASLFLVNQLKAVGDRLGKSDLYQALEVLTGHRFTTPLLAEITDQQNRTLRKSLLRIGDATFKLFAIEYIVSARPFIDSESATDFVIHAQSKLKTASRSSTWGQILKRINEEVEAWSGGTLKYGIVKSILGIIALEGGMEKIRGSLDEFFQETLAELDRRDGPSRFDDSVTGTLADHLKRYEFDATTTPLADQLLNIHAFEQERFRVCAMVGDAVITLAILIPLFIKHGSAKEMAYYLRAQKRLESDDFFRQLIRIIYPPSREIKMDVAKKMAATHFEALAGVKFLLHGGTKGQGREQVQDFYADALQRRLDTPPDIGKTEITDEQREQMETIIDDREKERQSKLIPSLAPWVGLGLGAALAPLMAVNTTSWEGAAVGYLLYGIFLFFLTRVTVLRDQGVLFNVIRWLRSLRRTFLPIPSLASGGSSEPPFPYVFQSRGQHNKGSYWIKGMQVLDTDIWMADLDALGFSRMTQSLLMRKKSKPGFTTHVTAWSRNFLGGLFYPLKAPFLIFIRRSAKLSWIPFLIGLLSVLGMPLIENYLLEWTFLQVYGVQHFTQPFLTQAWMWFAGLHFINLGWVFIINRSPRLKEKIYGTRSPPPTYQSAFFTLLAASVIALINIHFGWSPWSLPSLFSHSLVNLFGTTGGTQYAVQPNGTSSDPRRMSIDEMTKEILGHDVSFDIQRLLKYRVYKPGHLKTVLQDLQDILERKENVIEQLPFQRRFDVYRLAIYLGIQEEVEFAGLKLNGEIYQPMADHANLDSHNRPSLGYFVPPFKNWTAHDTNELSELLGHPAISIPREKAVVLDLFGGNGKNLAQLAPLFADSELHLLDAHPQNMRYAMEKFEGLQDSNRYEMKIGDARAGFDGIAYPDQHFDFIMMGGDSDFGYHHSDMRSLMFEVLRAINHRRGQFMVVKGKINRYEPAIAQVIRDHYPELTYRLNRLSEAGDKFVFTFDTNQEQDDLTPSAFSIGALLGAKPGEPVPEWKVKKLAPFLEAVLMTFLVGNGYFVLKGLFGLPISSAGIVFFTLGQALWSLMLFSVFVTLHGNHVYRIDEDGILTYLPMRPSDRKALYHASFEINLTSSLGAIFGVLSSLLFPEQLRTGLFVGWGLMFIANWEAHYRWTKWSLAQRGPAAAMGGSGRKHRRRKNNLERLLPAKFVPAPVEKNQRHPRKEKKRGVGYWALPVRL